MASSARALVGLRFMTPQQASSRLRSPFFGAHYYRLSRSPPWLVHGDIFTRVGRSAFFKRVPMGLKTAGGVGAALGFFILSTPEVHCDGQVPNAAHPSPASPQKAPGPLLERPQSPVNLYELTFGTICGICSGVFIKKGAKLVAFSIGGIFVLLQYLNSLSLIRVDWGRMGARFENRFFTRNPDGSKSAPSIYGLWTWCVDFLTADFQQRASFIAGLGLGLRLG